MGGKVDFAQLVKRFGNEGEPETRYSPGKCLGADERQIDGTPDMEFVSTSYAERQNVNIRMQNRRSTRLTAAFSKKAEMLTYNLAITLFYHKFVPGPSDHQDDASGQGRHRQAQMDRRRYAGTNAAESAGKKRRKLISD